MPVYAHIYIYVYKIKANKEYGKEMEDLGGTGVGKEWLIYEDAGLSDEVFKELKFKIIWFLANVSNIIYVLTN